MLILENDGNCHFCAMWNSLGNTVTGRDLFKPKIPCARERPPYDARQPHAGESLSQSISCRLLAMLIRTIWLLVNIKSV